MFYFELALQLGMTVNQLLANTTSKELSEWMAFFKHKSEMRDEQQQRAELELKASAGVRRRMQKTRPMVKDKR